MIATGSSGGDPSDVAKAISLLADGTIDAGSYIAAVGGMDSAEELISAVRSQQLDGKGVIYPGTRAALKRVDGWDAEQEARFLRERSPV